MRNLVAKPFSAKSVEALRPRIRAIVEKWGYRRQSPWDRKKPEDPALAAEEIYGIYDSSAGRPYDMREIVARVVDGSRFDEYKAETLRRMEEEQKEFGSFLDRLRFAKDKAEFDQFMAERRSRPPAPPTNEQPAG